MNTDTNEWRELDAYVTARVASLTQTLVEKEDAAARIEIKMLNKLRKDLGKPKGPPPQELNFGLHNG